MEKMELNYGQIKIYKLIIYNFIIKSFIKKLS